nr:MAG TPA: Thymidylate synthase [Caudoviricetes sp.]
MKQYLELVKKILDEGDERSDRTGTGTISIFSHEERYDISGDKIPLITTRKLNPRFAIVELLWFLRGSGDVGFLRDNNVRIWEQWTSPTSNSIGPLYPVQLRNWQSGDIKIDQIRELINGIKQRPNSRRHFISYWNPAYLPDESKDPITNVDEGRMALAPCHVCYQVYIDSKGNLSGKLLMRSSDVMVGRPANIFQYALLTKMIAHVTGYKPKEFIITTNDTHIYLDHVEQARELITREPYPSPSIWIDPNVQDIDEFCLDSFKLLDYTAHPPMKFPISV